MKRFFSLFLAVFLVFSFSFSVFADSSGSSSFDSVSSFLNNVSPLFVSTSALSDINSNLSNNLTSTLQYYSAADTSSGNSFRLSGGGSSRGGGSGRDYSYSYQSTGADNNNLYDGASSSGISSYQVFDSSNNSYYNPVSNSYDFALSINYSPEYDIYNIQSSEYNSYIFNNTTYITYYIEDTETKSTWYYEIYYRLPDGRNSYDLTADDVWGTYFIYDAVNYDEVAEDDGTTLALFHFDGNLKDSSFHNSSLVYDTNALYDFVDSDFTSALSWSDSQAHKMHCTLSEPLAGDFTIEGRIKITDSSNYSSTAYKSDGKYVYLRSDNARTDSDARSYAESNLGSGGTYSDSDSYVWVYSVSDVFTNKRVGNGKGVFYLLSSPLFQGDGSFEKYYSEATAKWWKYYKISATGGDICYSLSSLNTLLYSYSQTLDSFIYFAFVCSGDEVTYYENGLEKYSFSYSGSDVSDFVIQSTSKQSIIFDELRISNQALYTDSYTPSSQPFDTNLVLVLPSSGDSGNIAVKSNVAASGLRVGGVRPTYPTDGYVYVYLENDVVKDIQQYQTDGWYSVDACIYQDDSWSQLSGMNLASYALIDDDDGDNSSSSDGSDPSSGSDSSGNSSGGDSSDNGSTLGNLISSVFGGVVDAISAALKALLDIFSSLIEFCTGFGSFLASAFEFIPSEIITVITAGITLIVILAIIKFIRG